MKRGRSKIHAPPDDLLALGRTIKAAPAYQEVSEDEPPMLGSLEKVNISRYSKNTEKAPFLVKSLEKLASSPNSRKLLETRIGNLLQVLRTGHSVKLDHHVYLSLMHLAKTKPSIFSDPTVWPVVAKYLAPIKSASPVKGNNLLEVLISNLLFHGWESSDVWPVEFVDVFLLDSLYDRVWVDDTNCKQLVEGISTVFTSGRERAYCRFSDEDAERIRKHIPVLLKFFLRRPEAKSGKPLLNIIKVLHLAISLSGVRLLASLYLEDWINNAITSKFGKDFLKKVVLECRSNSPDDCDTLKNIVCYRIKGSNFQFYLEILRQLLRSNNYYPPLALQTFVYNIILPRANIPNSQMQILSIIFQHCDKSDRDRRVGGILQHLSIQVTRLQLRPVVRTLLIALDKNIDKINFVEGLLPDVTTLNAKAEQERSVMVMSILDTMCLVLLLHVSQIFIESHKHDASVQSEMLSNARSTAATAQMKVVTWFQSTVSVCLPTMDEEFCDSCLRKILFLEPIQQYFVESEHQNPETDTRVFGVFCELPVLEDTLIRLVLMNLRGTSLSQHNTLDILEKIILRSVALHQSVNEQEGAIVLSNDVLVRAMLQLAIYHPENVPKEKLEDCGSFVFVGWFWRACWILSILTCFNHQVIGNEVWNNVPTVRMLLEMMLTHSWEYPPRHWSSKDLAPSPDNASKILKFEQVISSEQSIKAGLPPPVISISNSSFLSQMFPLNPQQNPPVPPPAFIARIKDIEYQYSLGRLLCFSKNPDIVLDTVRRQGIETAMEWLLPILTSNDEVFQALPVEVFCELLLLSQSEDEVPHTLQGEGKVVIDKVIEDLQRLIDDQDSPSPTADIFAFFFKELSKESTFRKREAVINSLTILMAGYMDYMMEESSASAWLIALSELKWYDACKSMLIGFMYDALKYETLPVILDAYFNHIRDNDDGEDIWENIFKSFYHMLIHRPNVAELLLSDAKYYVDIASLFSICVKKLVENGKIPNTVTLTWDSVFTLQIPQPIFDSIVAFCSLPIPPLEGSSVKRVEEFHMKLLNMVSSTEQEGVPVIYVNGEVKSNYFSKDQAYIMCLSRRPSLLYLGLSSLSLYDRISILTVFGITPRTAAIAISTLAPQHSDVNATTFHAELVKHGINAGILRVNLEIYQTQCVDTLWLRELLDSEELGSETMDLESPNVGSVGTMAQPLSVPESGALKAISPLETEVNDRTERSVVELVQLIVGGTDCEQESALLELQSLFFTQTSDSLLQDTFTGILNLPHKSFTDNWSVVTNLLSLLLDFTPRGAFEPYLKTHPTITHSHPIYQWLGEDNLTEERDSGVARESPKKKDYSILKSRGKNIADVSAEFYPSDISMCTLRSYGRAKAALFELSHDTTLSRRARVEIALKLLVFKPPLDTTLEGDGDVIMDVTGDGSKEKKTETKIVNEEIMVTTLFSSVKENWEHEYQYTTNHYSKHLRSQVVDTLVAIDPEFTTLPLRQYLISRHSDTMLQSQLLHYLVNETNWDTLNSVFMFILTSTAVTTLSSTTITLQCNPTLCLDLISYYLYHPQSWNTSIQEKYEDTYHAPPTIHVLTTGELCTIADLVLNELEYIGKGRAKDIVLQSRLRLLEQCILQNESMHLTPIASHILYSGVSTLSPSNLYYLDLIEVERTTPPLTLCALTQTKHKQKHKHCMVKMSQLTHKHLLLLGLYLRMPQLIRTIRPKYFGQVALELNTHSALDIKLHRCVKRLLDPDTHSMAYMMCRQLAIHHPSLMLRYLHTLEQLLRSRYFGIDNEESRQQLLHLYLHILGILEVLRPQVFYQKQQLEIIFDRYYEILTTITTYASLFVPLITKFATFSLSYYTEYREEKISEDRMKILDDVYQIFHFVRELEDLRKTNAKRNRILISNTSVALDSIDEFRSNLTVYHTTNNNSISYRALGFAMDELNSLGRISQRFSWMLAPLRTQLTKFISWSSAHHPQYGPLLRAKGYDLILRLLRHEPKEAEKIMPQYLSVLESQHEDVVLTALEHCSEFFFFAPDQTHFLFKIFTLCVRRPQASGFLINVVNYLLRFKF